MTDRDFKERYETLCGLPMHSALAIAGPRLTHCLTEPSTDAVS